MASTHTATRGIRTIGTLAVLLSAVAVPAALAQFSFDPATNIALPTRPDGVATADFNGGGVLDLAVSRDGPDRVSIMLGAGDGTFAAPVNYLTGTGTGAGALVAADLDGDGDSDIAVALKGIDSVRVLLNSGGVFSAGSLTSVGQEPVDLAAADLNGDGKIDVVTVNRSANTISVLINSGPAAFTVTTISVGNDPRGVAIADYTGDGAPDLAITNHDDRSISVLRNLGAGTFTPHTLLSVGAQFRPEGIAAGALDANGSPDLAVAISGNGLNFAQVFLNAGAGTFGAPVNYATGGQNPSNVSLADMDCDGHLDIAISNQDSGTLAALRNLGPGTFGAAQLLTVGTTPQRSAVGDLDGDGDSDLVVANRDSDNVSVLMNQTCAVFILGDMNCDGVVTFDDINPFVLAISGQAAYEAQYPDCNWLNADLNQDGLVTFADINPFVALLGG